uniref:Ubiquitin-like domain-containing protein n=1 Tax=Otolemur garnettii TaxID=30611 RepID=H0XUR1_OTOGA
KQLFISAQELHPRGDQPGDGRPDKASLEGIAPDDQVMLLAGTTLEDDAILGQCGVEALTTLEVAGRVLGGIGSPAHAGKVRGQSPKAAKQVEKKKKKTGRAKRQMQYHQRFVNVVPTFGKKKGHNANS